MTIMRGIFITGTDTGVGKSAVAAAVAAALRAQGVNAGVMKPIQTGAIRENGRLAAPDGEYLRIISGVDDRPDDICPVMLETPVAPMVAAEIEGRTVDVGAIMDAYGRLQSRRELLVVEGAGGIAVPITPNYSMADLARDMDLPVLIVARASLGSINHTVLTVHYARAAGLAIAGIVINRYPSYPDVAEQTNPAAIERLCGVSVLGLLREDPAIDTNRGRPGSSVTAVGGFLEALNVRMPP
jgi:dethiobiotin synthetase